MSCKSAENIGFENIYNRRCLYKYSKTTVIYLAFIMYGLSGSLLGPTLPDLCKRLDVTAEELSKAFSATSLCWMLGALATGIILDRLHNYLDAFLFFATTTMGLVSILKPFSASLAMFVTWSCLEGFMWAFIDPVANLGVLFLWGKDADSPVQALHLMWGIGTLVGPFLCQPFLGPEDTSLSNSTNATTPSLFFGYQQIIPMASNPNEEERIEIPFIIAGAMSIFIGILALAYQFIPVPVGLDVAVPLKQSLSDVISPSTWVNNTANVAITLVTLMTFFYFSIGGREFITTTWFYSYGRESKLSMNQQQAIYLDGLNKGFYMFGRFVAIFAAKVLSPHMIIHISVYTSAVLSICLATYGNNGITEFFVFSCLMNFFTAPVWPGLITFLDKYIIVGAIVLNFTIVGGGLSGVFFQWASGWLFTYKEPESIMYLILLCSLIMTLTLVGIQILSAVKIGLREQADNLKEKTKFTASDNDMETHF